MSSVARERVEPGIEVVRLDRPEQRNAMDTAMLVELVAVLEELAADGALRVLVISTTSDRALCAGADVDEPLDEAGGEARMEAFTRFYAAVEAFPAPAIAVCVGNCVGAGAELAAGCDLRVAGDNLGLAFPGASLGVPVGPARLVPLVGLARAKELIFTGRVVRAPEAEALGLVHAVAPAAQAEGAAVDLARAIARQSPEGIRRLKAMLRALEGTQARVAYENERLLDFQREGPGLPHG